VIFFRKFAVDLRPKSVQALPQLTPPPVSAGAGCCNGGGVWFPDLNLHVNPYDNMTDEQLIPRLRVLREQIGDLDTLPQRRLSTVGPTKQ
jgi:hypothetical protein